MKTVLIFALVCAAFVSEALAANGTHIKEAKLLARSGQVVGEGRDNDCDGTSSEISAKVNVQDLSVTHISFTTCDGTTMKVAIADISPVQELQIVSPRDPASGQATGKRSATAHNGGGSGKVNLQDLHFVVSSDGSVQKATSEMDAQSRSKIYDKSSPVLAKRSSGAGSGAAAASYAISVHVDAQTGTVKVKTYTGHVTVLK